MKSVRSGLILLALIFFSPGPSSLFALETEISFAGRTIDLAEIDPEDDWEDYNTQFHRSVTPYLIEYAFGKGDLDLLAALKERISQEESPYFRAYTEVAGAYLRKMESPERLKYYRRAIASNSASEFRKILSHHIGMEVNFQKRGVRDPGIRSICEVESREDECTSVDILVKIQKFTAKRTLQKEDYEKIMEIIHPLLDGRGLNPSFSFLLLEPLPDILVSLGLPLEAAIIAEKISRNYDHPSVMPLRSRIPFYLGAAGDFPAAIKYSEKYHNTKDPVLLNVRMDWMILSENYKNAIDMLYEVGPEHLGGKGMKGMTDYWTGFPYSPGIVGSKLAMLLYLAGDIKNAGRSLDRLTDIPGKTPDGEPYKYYARLRMAQVFMEDNPELAHKIAEDITYIAQANSWNTLEYLATVLDGWANYHQKDYYTSVVQFVKAGGIYTHLPEGSVNPYSRLLGIFAARRKLRRRGNYDRLIKEIYDLLERRPYNRAVYTITYWAPVSADRAFFLQEMLASRSARRKRWTAFNKIIDQYQKEEKLYFKPGENPGGYNGLPTSQYWMREMKRFPYISTSGEGIRLPDFLSSTAKLIQKMEKQAMKTKITGQMFRNKEFYALPIKMGDEHVLFFVYPRKNSRGKYYTALTYTMLDRKEIARLKEGCPYPSEKCDMDIHGFNRFRKLMSGRKNIYLHILYSPGLDLDYEKLLTPARGHRVNTAYFSDVKEISDKKIKGSLLSYHPRGCGIHPVFPPSGQISGFRDYFNNGKARPAGIWFWPDAKKMESSMPVYLNEFECDSGNLLFWDMVRFSRSNRVNAVVYNRRNHAGKLNRAFVRYFTSEGAILVEKGVEFQQKVGDFFNRILENNYKKGIVVSFLRAAYLTRQKYGTDVVRVVLPGILR